MFQEMQIFFQEDDLFRNLAYTQKLPSKYYAN
jgi:hypothetical protein